MNPGPMRKAYYFSTRDLVLIAAISAAGGVLSTYVGYLGNLMNKAFGVPFGAGQWMAGLHVFWFVFARAIVGRTGAASLTGILKGIVEMFAGST
ncbi:MAG TPA: ECF transporter S component, partial [Bacillota bacterium]|nr:ECF transporter S component [Bacillota bacterium]